MQNINLECETEDKLFEMFHDCYKCISDDIKIVIECLDFDVGKFIESKNCMFYLRQRRIKDHIENLEQIDYIITCRNDIEFSDKIDISEIGTNFYTILRKYGGRPGYAHGDYDFCFLYNKKTYMIYCECMDTLWEFKDNVYHKTEQLRYVSPIFIKQFPHRGRKYYIEIGRNFDTELANKNVSKMKLKIPEVLINHLTNHLLKNQSYFDVFTFQDIHTEQIFAIN